MGSYIYIKKTVNIYTQTVTVWAKPRATLNTDLLQSLMQLQMWYWSIYAQVASKKLEELYIFKLNNWLLWYNLIWYKSDIWLLLLFFFCGINCLRLTCHNTAHKDNMTAGHVICTNSLTINLIIAPSLRRRRFCCPLT